jgi:predicted DsbA family dithiol-disulfide isomerase
LREDYDVEVEWRAFELHPGIPPGGEPIPWPPERRAAGLARVKQLTDELGLPLGERTHWYDSTPAHEAAEWARASYSPHIDEEFRRAIFHAYFVDGRNIGSPDVLAELAEGLQLDGAALREALADHRYLPAVRQQYQEARETGVDGVPTYVAGGYAIVGAQPYEVFHQLMAAIGQPPRAERADLVAGV